MDENPDERNRRKRKIRLIILIRLMIFEFSGRTGSCTETTYRYVYRFYQ